MTAGTLIITLPSSNQYVFQQENGYIQNKRNDIKWYKQRSIKQQKEKKEMDS